MKMAYGKAGRPKTTGWLSIKEAATRLGISYYGLREGVEAGTVPSLQLGRRRVIAAEEVEYIKKHGYSRRQANEYKEKAEYPNYLAVPTAERVC
jgi:excisionase family DNA binding protein